VRFFGLRSGWVRLFVTVWATSLVMFGYRFYKLRDFRGEAVHQLQMRINYQDSHPHMTDGERWVVKAYEEAEAAFDKWAEPYDNADFQFYVFGLAAPPLTALAAWWIVRGFRRDHVGP
jgi:hypothetical protein